MKKIIVVIIILIIVASGVCAWWFLRDEGKNQTKIERIGIGGGGAFLSALIDPTDENIYYATCDMGGLYYSYNQGMSNFQYRTI